MKHSISDQGLHQGRAFTPARPFAGNFQGSKLGKEVCIRRDLGLWGCWGHMGVGPRGRRGKLDLQLRCCQGARAGKDSIQAGLLCLLAGEVGLHPLLAAPPPIFLVLASVLILLFLSRTSFIWDFSCFFSYFLFPFFLIYTSIGIFFSFTFLFSFLVFC